MNQSTLLIWTCWDRIQARRINVNRIVGVEYSGESAGWDIETEFDPKASGWADRVHAMIPRIEEDEMVVLRRLEHKFNLINGDKRGRRDSDHSQQDAGEGMGGIAVFSVEEEVGVPGGSR